MSINRIVIKLLNLGSRDGVVDAEWVKLQHLTALCITAGEVDRIRIGRNMHGFFEMFKAEIGTQGIILTPAGGDNVFSGSIMHSFIMLYRAFYQEKFNTRPQPVVMYRSNEIEIMTLNPIEGSEYEDLRTSLDQRGLTFYNSINLETAIQFFEGNPATRDAADAVVTALRQAGGRVVIPPTGRAVDHCQTTEAVDEIHLRRPNVAENARQIAETISETRRQAGPRPIDATQLQRDMVDELQRVEDGQLRRVVGENEMRRVEDGIAQRLDVNGCAPTDRIVVPERISRPEGAAVIPDTAGVPETPPPLTPRLPAEQCEQAEETPVEEPPERDRPVEVDGPAQPTPENEDRVSRTNSSQSINVDIGTALHCIPNHNALIRSYNEAFNTWVDTVDVSEGLFDTEDDSQLIDNVVEWNSEIMHPLNHDVFCPGGAASSQVTLNVNIKDQQRKITELEDKLIEMRARLKLATDKVGYKAKFMRNINKFINEAMGIDIVKHVGLVLHANRPKNIIVHFEDLEIEYDNNRIPMKDVFAEISLKAFLPNISSRGSASSNIHILSKNPVLIDPDSGSFSQCPHARVYRESGIWTINQCMQDYAIALDDAMRHGSTSDLVYTIVEFIKSYNPNDCYGESIKYYPTI